MLRIYEFHFNSGGKISKEKELWKFWELKSKYDKNFELTNCLFSLTLFFLFVLNKQVKAEVLSEAAIQMCY